MPTTAGAQGKVAAAANGRVRNRVLKDRPASSKKPRQRGAAKLRAAGNDTNLTVDNQPDPSKSGLNPHMDTQSSNLQIVPVPPPPPPNNSRKRKGAAAACQAAADATWSPGGAARARRRRRRSTPCCSTCPSAFHPECLAIKVLEGSWACHYCRCMLCMFNDDQGMSTCQQCSGKYHQHCRPLMNNAHNVGAYCSKTCKKFFQLSAQVSDMVGVTNPTEDDFSWSLLKIQKDKPVSSQDMAVVLECSLKLAAALGVLNECFNPIKVLRT